MRLEDRQQREPWICGQRIDKLQKQVEEQKDGYARVLQGQRANSEEWPAREEMSSGKEQLGMETMRARMDAWTGNVREQIEDVRMKPRDGHGMQGFD